MESVLPFAIAFVLLGIPLLSTLFVLVKGIIELRQLRGRERIHDEILRTGSRCPARVRSLTQTGTFINENPEVIVTLEVRQDERGPYEVTTRFALPLVHMPLVQTLVTVAISNNDPTTVVICFEPYGSLEESARAARGWGHPPSVERGSDLPTLTSTDRFRIGRLRSLLVLANHS